MSYPKLLAIPDELQGWQGTAATLADKLNDVLPKVGLPDEAGVASERLVRYYVAEGVLTEPDKGSRDGGFGFRQIVEFIVARQYLADGWPLAKVRDLVQTDETIRRIPATPGAPMVATPTTRAERALSRLRGKPAPGVARPSVRGAVIPPAPMPAWPAAGSTFVPPDPAATLQRAKSLTTRRAEVQETLRELGNPSGQPGIDRLLRIELTPWCQVLIDTKQLAAMNAEATQKIGMALTHVLERERVATGEKK